MTCGESFGLTKEMFTGRSLRIGGCTTAVASGAINDEITRATVHAHEETSRIYMRSSKHKSTSLGYGFTVGMQDLRRMNGNSS